MEPEVYLWLAEGRGWRITHVLDTHVHADHLSRSRRLAELVGASVHMPEEATVSYPFSALGDGDVLRVGSATLEAILTPGHRPECTSYLLDEQALFCRGHALPIGGGPPRPGRHAGGLARDGPRTLPLPAAPPPPKAGVFAEAEARVAARNIAAEIDGGRGGRFDGTGYCFLEFPGQRASALEGHFFAQPPEVRLAEPDTETFARKQAFEAERLRDWLDVGVS
jgi:hypothetical protein